MQKNKKRILDTRTLVFLAFLAALQIVLSKFVSIDVGFCRITISNAPIVLAGLWFGPVAGGLCGMLADMLGCLLKGYAVNPLITLSTMTWGVIPALMCPLMKGSKVHKTIILCLSIALTTVCGTLVLTTAGLIWMNGYSLYGILPSRVIQWAVMTPVYCVVVSILYFSPLTVFVRNGIERRMA